MDNQHFLAAGSVSDDEIIMQVLHGQKNTYGVLMRRYNQRLYRIAMSVLNNESEAEDAMQTAYINAYENLGKFAFKSSFSTWLTKILINESLLLLKKRNKSAEFMHEQMKDDIVYRQHYPQVSTPAAEAVNAELKTILEKTIRELPEKYRIVFVMREIEGMNIAETKQCLDISEVNVKVRLNRAKSLLKEMLSKFYKHEEILSFHLSRCDRMVENVLKLVAPI